MHIFDSTCGAAWQRFLGLLTNISLHNAPPGRAKLARPFDLGSYARAEMTGTPHGPGLVHLADVLGCLLHACPGGVINHGPFCTALTALLQEDDTLRGKGASAAEWPSVCAHRLRVALAHVRRLQQQPRLLQRTTKGLATRDAATLRDLISKYKPDDGDAEDDAEDITGNPPEPTLAEPTLPEPTLPEPTLPETTDEPPAETTNAAPAQTPGKQRTSALPDFSPFLPTPTRPEKKRARSASPGPASGAAAVQSPPVLLQSPQDRVALSPTKIGLLMDALTSTVPRPAGVRMQRKQVQQARQATAEGKAEAKAQTQAAEKTKKSKKKRAQVLKRPAKAAAPSAPPAECAVGPLGGDTDAEDLWEAPPQPSRGAASAETNAEAEAQPVRYHKMFYKSSGAWGIRQRGGGQVMQVMQRGKNRAESEPLVDDCIALLEGGQSVAEVRAWAAQHLQRDADAELFRETFRAEAEDLD